MNEKLREALTLVDDMTADINGEYPVGLLRVRRLLEEVLEEMSEEDVYELAPEPVENEIIDLTAEPPQPAA